MTRVKFLISREDNKTVFAYFPDIIDDNNENRMCYAFIGQHSKCSPAYAKLCRDASIIERKDLLKELIFSIGYNDLKIINKTL